MPFRIKNVPATFQRMIYSFLHNILGCEVYIDDVIIYNTTCVEHLHIIKQLFCQLENGNLSVNLNKTEFCHAKKKKLPIKRFNVQQKFSPLISKLLHLRGEVL